MVPSTYNHGVSSCGNPSSNAYRRGCRCDACRALNSKRAKRYRQQVLRGENDRMVDAGPSRERLLKLRELGYSDKEIERFGVGSVWRIVNQSKMVRKSTEDIVMAISGRRFTKGQKVDAGAARYILAEWLDAGFTVTRIAKEAGLCRSTITEVMTRDDKKVAMETLMRILTARPKMKEIAAREGKTGNDKQSGA